MSSDDIILIVRHSGFYEGYWVMGDVPKTVTVIRKLPLKFKVKTIEEAIIKGQAEHAEYGVYFVNLKLKGEDKP